jgi:regulator of protease activity HflC (stomatin/prohibitin superfamily)
VPRWAHRILKGLLMFALAITALILTIIALVVTILLRRRVPQSEPGRRSGRITANVATGVTAVLAAVTFLVIGFGSFYSQDAGEAIVLRDVTGNIVGQSDSTGLHTKMPWVETIDFNIRNQQVVFAGGDGSTTDYNGGVAAGPQITVQDADGVSSNIDIALRYSIRPSAVIDIYREFQSEANFKASFIDQDVRSVVRLVPNSFSTIDLITKRGDVESAILAALESRWEDDGVIVDSISLQEIRPPQAVVESYAAAQQAQINVTTEQANLDAAKVSAQQKVVQAQADADSNHILAESLTEPVLQNRYLDTLKTLAAAGNVVVVPEGFNGLVNVTKAQ